MLRPIWLGRNENLLFPPAISHAVNEEGKTQRKCATGSSVAAQHDAALNSTCHRFLPMLGCCLLLRAYRNFFTLSQQLDTVSIRFALAPLGLV